ncbi:heavy metal translocating P-type ATPase [Alkaliphilus oremlandii]|uniref:Cd(2+)-exporting ATPase n=1 Tax=Alkaliphilus oremlandii (strain OhILAs) TaxID=350688 RepID=A8MIR6_ALKOO|nr:heavy metal translocating P-type ATPase [Alkaliphilus oremlandii]ABW19698.1 heavy metal translocating P-type ATPase [Alkaliphilus oremlandii OhILAs]
MSSEIKDGLRREFILEGLHCANCASKIETRVNELEEVQFAHVNFVTKTLVIEANSLEKIEDIIHKMKDIVKKLEPDVLVKEKSKARKNIHRNHSSHGQCCDHDHDHSEGHSHSHKEEPGHRVDNHSHGHDHDHGHSHGNGNHKTQYLRLGIGALLFAMAAIFKVSNTMEFILFFASYILIGGEVVLRAAKNILRGQVFDENFLMAIATIGAFAIGEFSEGVAVMLFYQIGELFQDIAVNRSRKSIAELMDIRPDYANLKIGNGEKKVSPEEVQVGDYIIVKPGEKIPLDGVVIEGVTMMDTSALTGESVPREIQKGSNVLSGFINKNGVVVIEVTKSFEDSTVAKILDLVENASGKKAPTENFITKFARYYTPIVVYAALGLALIPPLFVEGATFSEWIYRALIFLVVSCPCALVISIPLGFFGGIGGASKNGILIKGGNYLEALNNVETVIFDKTGTLTKGVFKVTEIQPNNISKEELLEFAAFAESYSNHPIAVSILNEYGKTINKEEIESYEEISGHGIRVKVKGKVILAGNARLMESFNIPYHPAEAIGTIVYMAVDGSFAGHIIISDEIKKDAKEAIKVLKNIGVKKTVMLTGDNKLVGTRVGSELGLDEVYAELLPDQKVEKLEMLDRQKSEKGKLVFVGDGINDAPVLARADIGVAMGGLGSDAAIEAADVVLMTDEPMKLVSAIKIAKRTRRIVWQNIAFAFIVKAIVLVLGAGGLATMWEAVFADVGVALIAILNSMRVLNVKDL